MASLEELETRVKHLEYQFRIVRQLTDPERYPFGQYILDADLTKEQAHALTEIVERVDKDIMSGGQMTFWEFVERVYAVIPERGKDGKFARSVLNALHEGRQFPEVYEHMMKHGMMVIS